MSREKKLLCGSISGLFGRLVALVCGFITPSLILDAFGSDVNGLISSITQFLGIINILEAGISSVIDANLYVPLANRDYEQISRLYRSSQNFFNKVGLIFIIYVVILSLCYPLYINKDFDKTFTSALFIIMAMSMFMEYFVGVSYLIILNADQKQYFTNILNCAVLILSTFISSVLIKAGFSIHIVKFGSAMVFVFKPIIMKVYADKVYFINRKIRLEQEPIEQKWNGLAQHIAFTVNNSTDTVVLTFFSTLSNVSIYSVYALILNGITGILTSMTSSISPYLGNVMINESRVKLNCKFSVVEWCIHTVCTILFTATGFLIVPFVRIYTLGIDDADYIVPVFAVVITIACALKALRIPYNSLIFVAGHFKQTQNSSIMEALINIIISVIAVYKMGLVGVAVGTLCAMLYRLIYLILYLSNNILNRSISYFVKNMVVDILIISTSFFVLFPSFAFSAKYSDWIIMAAKVVVVILFFSVLYNLIFFNSILRQCVIWKRK